MSVAASLDNIRIHFGNVETTCLSEDSGLQLNLASPLLDGPESEILLACENASHETGEEFSLLHGEGVTVGMAVIDCDSSGLEASANKLYDELLAHTRDLNVYRLWNFVPRINDDSSGQENYRSFNVGRWKAFAEVYGEVGMNSHLPAASAVGLQEENNRLAVVFLAGSDPVHYFENPRQTPAYHYPREYGPCSPSFARGAVVDHGDRRIGYLSGTSSICGCDTIGQGDLQRQFSETIENIGEALRQMGFGGWPENNGEFSSRFRVYIREAADYPSVRKWFAEVVGEEVAGQSVFIQADICRQPLKLEIEGVFQR